LFGSQREVVEAVPLGILLLCIGNVDEQEDIRA